VSFQHIDFDALAPATEVLAAVGANLGPGAGPVGTWTVRVPLHTGSGVYLMLVHGGVSIAIPWHAVLRLHMAGAADLVEHGSLGGWPVLNGPLGGPPRPVGDVPLALVAHGRKRGWLVADRLVWRLHAEPVAPTERSPADGLVTMVETEEGEHYWLAEPEWLLRSSEAPASVRSTPESAPEPAPGAERPALREALPESFPVAPAPPVPARPAPHLWLLTPEDVERIEAGDAERIEAGGAAAATRAVEAPSATASAPPVRRPMLNALVAEDSITARIFLARLLTRLGFDVSTVDTAAALRAELERCPWSLVCVDIELPDEAGTAFLAGLAARHGARTPFVALVRDADDRVAARRAGFERMLRKPFDHQELEQVLGRLGLLTRRP
jgi:CheY-like chemotaxis protein